MTQCIFYQGRKLLIIIAVYASEAADRVLKYGRPLINDGAILFCMSILRP